MAQNILQLVNDQRAFFRTHKTIDPHFRIEYLKKLRAAIRAYEADIAAALKADLGKSENEAFMCEIGLTLTELTHQIRHAAKWSRGRRCSTHLANFPAASFTVPEPYGVVLVMSPWNYPFMLTMEPVIGAIAAGNCCVIKPSAYSPATSAVIRTIISEVFPPEYAVVVEGGRAENTELLNQHFDYIFFTGSVNVGRKVLEKAAQHITPVTLELGGKSPCIIDETANIPLAAARVVFGKYLNCGQTCVAPDYVLIDRKVKDAFLAEVRRQIRKMFGDEALANQDYGRIINRRHFDRLLGLIDENKLFHGGRSDAETLRIEPTVLTDVTPDDDVMQEEIFGPIMPVIAFDTIDEAEAFVSGREKPLALYLFTSDKATEARFLRWVPFGGGCINDTIVHLASTELTFGGVGQSGMGSYHGKKSFETFSHEKSILKKFTWLDLPFRYQPYTKTALRLMKMLLK